MNFKAGLLIILIMIVLPIFGHLTDLPILMWDESRLAVNAIEMLHSKNYLVASFMHKPDMWNTKPPLLIWLQLLSIKIFGINELAIRMPSAIAALFTFLLVYWFIARKLKKPLLGVLACFVLVTAEGYVKLHGTRSGDYDALLTLFTTTYIIFYFLFLQEQKRNYLYVTVLGIMLATLTKGIAGLILLPGLLLFTVAEKKVYTLMKNRDFYIGITFFIFLVAGYYLLREHYNPGYTTAVMNNEMTGRYNTVIEEHQGDGWFYLDYLSTENFRVWYLFLPLGAAIGMSAKETELRKLAVFICIIAISFFIVLTSSRTKLPWYDMPVYPFLSIIVALPFYHVIVYIWPNVTTPTLKYSCIAVMLISAIIPYRVILTKTLSPEMPSYEKSSLLTYLKLALHGEKDVNNCSLITFDPNTVWYVEALNEKGIRINFTSEDKLTQGQKVIAFENGHKETIEKGYYSGIIDTFYEVKVYKIDSVK